MSKRLTSEAPPRPALLILTGWHGRTKQPVLVVGETPQRYRITTVGQERVRLAGPRWLEPGTTALVPHYAIRFPAAEEGA